MMLNNQIYSKSDSISCNHIIFSSLTAFRIQQRKTHDGYLTLDGVDCSKCFKFGGLVSLAL